MFAWNRIHSCLLYEINQVSSLLSSEIKNIRNILIENSNDSKIDFYGSS
jgi:hypothetical protein